MTVAKKNDLAYQLLKRRILTREYMPGDRVIVNRVGKELGISVIPIREALSRLESERLVEIIPYAGAVVTSLDNEEILRIMEMTAVLEGYATRGAMNRAAEIVSALERLNEDMTRKAEADDWMGFADRNRQFHLTIYGVCENQSLIDSLQSLWDRFTALSRMTLFPMIPERARRSIEEHRQMIELLADPFSDPLQLEIVARNHKLRTMDAYADEVLGQVAEQGESR